MLNRLLSDKAWQSPTDIDVFAPLIGQRNLQVVDVGARGGLHERWRPFQRFVEMVGFEPDPEECRRLTDADRSGRVRYLPFALGAARATRPFYLCKQLRCSSLYPPNEAFVSAFAPAIAASMTLVRQSSMDVVALDEVAASEQLHIDAMKIDVQGAELEVLQGGARALQGVKLVELEVEFNAQYQGQPLFGELDSYMRSQGFALLALRRTYWRRREGIEHGVAGGQLVHGDALYYNERLLAADTLDARELAAWLMLLSAYRQDDFVLHLLEGPRGAALLDAATRDRLRRVVLAQPRPGATVVRALVRTLLRGVEHHALRAWLDASRPQPADDWHDPDFF